MIKKILLLCIICISTIIHSQETIFSFENDLKKSSSDIKDVIPIVNEKTGEIAFFVADAKNVYAYKLNKQFEVVDKMTSENKERKFKQFVGYSISKNGDYNLYLQNNGYSKKFLEIKFSFKKKTVSLKKFSLKNSTEIYVESISYKNKFYIISAYPHTRGFVISFFNENKEFNRKLIGNKIEDFLTKKNKKISVGRLLYDNKTKLSLIDKDVPNSIEIVGKPLKIYKEQNSLIFSFDNNPLYTQLFSVNLKSFNCSATKFIKPLQNITSKKKTNSFLFEDKIALMSSFSKGLQLNIVDTTSRKVLKEFLIHNGKEIKFKNTPIIQEGGMYNDYREMESSKKFLRKINSSNVGVSFKRILNGNYQIVIGGYKEQRTAPMPMGGFGGMPIAGIGGLTVSINPTQFAFNSYANTKSTRIESLVDEDFNHLKGRISENAFDKMKDYNSTSNGATVFKYFDFYIKTNYKTFSKTFTFKKFID